MDQWVFWFAVFVIIGIVAGSFMKGITKGAKMKTYQVWLKGMSKYVEVNAEDFEVDSPADNPFSAEIVYYNFLVKEGESSVTVAAFPFANVEYVVSMQHVSVARNLSVV